MTTQSLQTLRPNATVSNSGYTVTGGASAQAVTSDNSDSSYLAVTTSPAVVALTLTTFAFPATALLKGVRVRARCIDSSGFSTLYVSMADATGNEWTQDSFSPLPTAITTVSGSTHMVMDSLWSAPPITFAAVNAMQLIVYTWSATLTARIHELYIDVYYNQAPVVSAVGPTGTITTTMQPTITYTYTDPELDTQQRHWVKIFSDAVHAGGGFSPDTSVAVWDSGERVTAATSRQCEVLTGNGVFWAYVKASDNDSNGRYGAWASSSFTISVPGAPNPTVTATADNANNRVAIAMTAGSSPSTEYFAVQRSVDSGVTWTTINANVTNSGGTITIYDYAAPTNIPVTYQVQAVHVVSGLPLGSAWVQPTAVGGLGGIISLDAGGGYMRISSTGTIQCLKSRIAVICDSGAFTLTAGQTYHVVWTKNGSANHLYINGVDVTSNLVNATCTTGTTTYVGSDVPASVEFFSGTIDEAAIYGFALTPTQVAANYTNGRTAGNYATTVQSLSPLFYYRLDESGGITATDSSSNGRNGTYTGTGVAYHATSLLATDADYAATFDGAGGYMSVANALTADTFTLEAWVRPSTVTVTVSSWWLKDPAVPAHNRTITVVGKSLIDKRDKGGGVFWALGRTNAVAVRDVVKSAVFSLKVRAVGTTEYNALVGLYTSGHILLIQSDMGQQWYVDLSGMDEELMFYGNRTTKPTRDLTFVVTEVDPP